jgi:hypothetical protein
MISIMALPVPGGVQAVMPLDLLLKHGDFVDTTSRDDHALETLQDFEANAAALEDAGADEPAADDDVGARLVVLDLIQRMRAPRSIVRLSDQSPGVMVMSRPRAIIRRTSGWQPGSRNWRARWRTISSAAVPRRRWRR